MLTAKQRWRGTHAVFLSVALAMSLALAGCQIGQAGTRPQNTPSTPSPTPAPSGWTVVTNSAVARQAPASIHTIYRTLEPATNSPGSFVLQRSDDAGATWANEAWPKVTGASLPADLTDGGNHFWSPHAPMMMFLELWLKNDALCPLVDQVPIPVINGIARETSTTGKLCQLTFVTDDGGATWRPLTLPASLTGGFSGIDDASATPTSGSVVTQGSRVYALFNSSAGYNRLATSDDGGATWRLVDGPIAAAGQQVVDYAAAPTGRTLFALTNPIPRQPPYADTTRTLPPVQFWRSNDGGATWTHAGTPPGQRMDGLSAAADPNTGAAVVYLLSDSPNDIDLHLYASLDGGRSWPHTVDLHTEEGGAPASPYILTPLPDGAIVLYDGSGLGSLPPYGSPDTALSPLSAWRYNLGAVWTLTQPTGVSLVTQVGVQTAPGGATRLWLAGLGANGKRYPLEYTDIPT